MSLWRSFLGYFAIFMMGVLVGSIVLKITIVAAPPSYQLTRSNEAGKPIKAKDLSIEKKNTSDSKESIENPQKESEIEKETHPPESKSTEDPDFHFFPDLRNELGRVYDHCWFEQNRDKSRVVQYKYNRTIWVWEGIEMNVNQLDDFSIRMDSTEHMRMRAKLFQSMYLFNQLADRKGITYWGTKGNVIAYVRDNKTSLPWDFDFDVYVNKQDWSFFEELWNNAIPINDRSGCATGLSEARNSGYYGVKDWCGRRTYVYGVPVFLARNRRWLAHRFLKFGIDKYEEFLDGDFRWFLVDIFGSGAQRKKEDLVLISSCGSKMYFLERNTAMRYGKAKYGTGWMKGKRHKDLQKFDSEKDDVLKNMFPHLHFLQNQDQKKQNQ